MQGIKNNLDKLKWMTIDNVIEQLTSKKYGDISYLHFLTNILDREVEFINRRRNLINLKIAGFPSIKTLEEFDFNFQPDIINQNKILELATLDFIDKKQNLIFIGNPGVGKTHLSIAIGVKAITGKKSTYFLHYSKLIFELKKAKDRNMLEDRLKHFSKYKVLIVDEIGYLPLDIESGNMFFQLINKFYENKSMIITTNKPFNEWGDLFGDNVIATAILDRLLHHSIIININGKSYRTHQALKENGIELSE